MNLDGFLSWLQTSKVSVQKQQRIAEIYKHMVKHLVICLTLLVASRE